MIDMHRRNPRILLEIRYATANNFTHTALYDRPECWLNGVAAARLDAVQKELETQGLGLKVWDCYRPLSVQKKFWALVPDERYVANPAKGSRHNRGAAVDLTLVGAGGSELLMPTAHDDFTTRAHRDFTASAGGGDCQSRTPGTSYGEAWLRSAAHGVVALRFGRLGIVPNPGYRFRSPLMEAFVFSC